MHEKEGFKMLTRDCLNVQGHQLQYFYFVI